MQREDDDITKLTIFVKGYIARWRWKGEGEPVEERIQLGWSALPPVHQTIIGAFLLYLSAVCLSAFFPFPVHNDTALFLYRQDRWLLLVQCTLLLVGCSRLEDRQRPLHLSPWLLALFAVGMLGLCYAGSTWVLFGYQISRDEQMAVFD